MWSAVTHEQRPHTKKKLTIRNPQTGNKLICCHKKQFEIDSFLTSCPWWQLHSHSRDMDQKLMAPCPTRLLNLITKDILCLMHKLFSNYISLSSENAVFYHKCFFIEHYTACPHMAQYEYLIVYWQWLNSLARVLNHPNTIYCEKKPTLNVVTYFILL